MYFATYFDKNYIHFFLTLYQSLQTHCSDFVFYAVCLDEEAFDRIKAKKLPNVVAVSFKEYEKTDADLLEVKPTRSKVEYIFTSGPSILLHLFDKYPEIDLLTYLDSDLFFFDNPQYIFDELGQHDIGIISHKLTGWRKVYEKYGIYNVGWVSFRRSIAGLACLKQWRDDCLEWCYDSVEPTRFADQKYLDKWQAQFPTLKVIEQIGANLAPWNVGDYKLTMNDERLTTDKTGVHRSSFIVHSSKIQQPLVFFHFSSLKQRKEWLFTTGTSMYRFWLSGILRHKIYGAYIPALQKNLLSEQGAQPALNKRRQKTKFGFAFFNQDNLKTSFKKLIFPDYIIYRNGKIF